MRTRLAELKDAAVIAPLYEDFFIDLAQNEPRYYRPFGDCEGYAARTITQDGADIIIACDESGIAGFLHVHEMATPQLVCFIPKKYAMVADVYVRPEYRKQGVASMLLKSAGDWARNRSLSYMELRVLEGNAKAINLYEKEGYDVVIHVMRKEL